VFGKKVIISRVGKNLCPLVNATLDDEQVEFSDGKINLDSRLGGIDYNLEVCDAFKKCLDQKIVLGRTEKV